MTNPIPVQGLSEALQACPHCGSSLFARVKPYPWEKEGEADLVWGYHVLCDASGFDNRPRGCGAASGWAETPAEAAEAWNTRALTELQHRREAEAGTPEEQVGQVAPGRAGERLGTLQQEQNRGAGDMMGKEQELLALLAAAEKWLMTSRLPGHEVAAINTATAIRDAREIIARRSSSDEQAEVVAWRGKYRADEKWKYFDHPFDGFDPDKYQLEPLFASPSEVIRALTAALAVGDEGMGEAPK